MLDSTQRMHSGDAMIQQIQRLSDAGGSLIQIKTREPLRAAMTLRTHFTKGDTPYREWSASTGWRNFTVEDVANNAKAGEEVDFVSALAYPLTQLRSPTSEVNAKSDVVHFFAYLDPGPHLQNPYVIDLITQYAGILPSANVAILFITPDAPMEGVPPGLFLSAELQAPTEEELSQTLTPLIDSITQRQSLFTKPHKITEEEIRRVCLLGLGLSSSEFETHVALSIINAAADKAPRLTVEHLIEGVSRGKTEVVRESEILELMQPEDMANVGGMQRLKDWVGQRASCYSDEAKEFGIDPPKGLVLVGVPGTGKSLAAKALASELGVPLVRLDFGRVFSKYVGDSEQRVRSALHMVESMAPCVLFADEIDKGLGGMGGGGGDNGTSLRVLGTYLTWLQELKAPVFNMVTANRVEGLPPELLRRGRFDQIFSVSLPSPRERKDVLAIHLRKRGREIGMFSPDEIRDFVARSERYVPAEIESALKDALIAAYSQGEQLEMRHILHALSQLVPMSKSHAAQIETIVAWAANNAIPVSDPSELSDPELAAPVRGRRIVTPTAGARKVK